MYLLTTNQSSDDDHITGWDKKYIRNSIPFTQSTSYARDLCAWQYASICISVTILVHSYVINGLRPRVVRIITDIAALTTFGEALILILILENHVGLKAQCYLVNVVGLGVLGLLTQVADNYGVYSRYIIVNPKFPNKLRYLTFAAVVGLMYGTWWPTNTFLPWFTNLNSKNRVIITLNNIYSYSYIAFNCIFTFLLLYELYNRQHRSVVYGIGDEYSLYIVAFKAITHNIFSIFGIMASLENTHYGITWYNLCVCISLHLINWKFEKYLKVFGYRGASSTVSLTSASSSSLKSRVRKSVVYLVQGTATGSGGKKLSKVAPSQTAAYQS